MNRHELSLLNNPRTILCYRDKVDLNLDSYVSRQNTFTQKMASQLQGDLLLERP